MYHTAAGALALYQATLAAFQYTNGVQQASIGGTSTSTTRGAFVDFVLETGELTDELQTGQVGCPSASALDCSNILDSRSLATGSDYGNYAELQGIRGGAALGIGALAAYDSSAPPAFRGQLYALAGYADILLADLYCSGIPLSTLDFAGDFTYAAGDLTAQVYRAAIVQFDTALTSAGDSTRIEYLALIGKARAYLDLGQFDSAAVYAAHVPDGFSYQFLVDWQGGLPAGQNIFNVGGRATVADKEGINGLPYISSGDPRTASQVASTNGFGVPQYVPVKYGGASPGVFPITVADWIEARLIRAEAALHAGDISGWLTQLNDLRTNAVTPALPQLNDPGTPATRVNLLFQERAYWLFLTGHRQGDLRRLIRQYGRSSTQVYPTGLYPTGRPSEYGTDVTVSVPSTESVNSLYHGCYSRGA